MGWSNCGTDSKGRPIGYGFDAVCDHPGCNTPIDRGLSYACGGMHGTETLPASSFVSCEGYFCSIHLCDFVEVDGEEIAACASCVASLGPDWELDEEEALWRQRVGV